jgi:protoheme IX farnesyltransferase
MEAIKTYYKLTKPGIIYGNTLTAIAGFFVASEGKINGLLLLALVVGLAFVIASACVLNNIIDRGIDKKMKRTKTRALVTGEISPRGASIYAVVLGMIGFGTLFLFVNLLAVWLGAAAYVLYIAAYGIAKRKTVHGTLVGSIPGALPPVAGYVAVTNSIDGTAFLLFLILVLWQMPHFYAIAMFRQKEYEAANIPVLPIVKGHRVAKNQILFYILLFIIAAQALPNMGIVYSVAMLVLGGLWLAKALHGFKTRNDEKWARGLFGFSLYVLLGFSMFAIVDAWLV